MSARKLQHFIGGEFVGGNGGDHIPSLNPSDPNDVVAEGPKGASDSVDSAVSAAAAAQVAWRSQIAGARGNMLYAWADAINARAEEIAQAVCREVGKPISEARGETGRCVALLRYYAGEAVHPNGDVIPAGKPGGMQFSMRQASGVAGLITPWNFPVAIPVWKAAPALAFGNTVVLKPSEMSPLCAALLAETASAAGIPAGVFNVVFGASEAGSALVIHAGVNLVSFTGSSAVGGKVGESCAKRNVKFQTEMGGKNVGIVLQDADIAKAANLVAGGAMRYAGQKCTATSRVIVDKTIMGPFLEALKSSVAALSLGPVTETTAAIGPVISKASQDRIEAALDASDCKFAMGCKLEDETFKNGYFVAPTVAVEVHPTSDLAQKELFGPVLAVLEADGLESALKLANDVPFGLSAALFTRDISNALTYIDRIEAGMVRVNGDTTGVDPYAPFGGMKASGSHSREQGVAAREFYTEIKTVELNP